MNRLEGINRPVFSVNEAGLGVLKTWGLPGSEVGLAAARVLSALDRIPLHPGVGGEQVSKDASLDVIVVATLAAKILVEMMMYSDNFAVSVFPPDSLARVTGEYLHLPLMFAEEEFRRIVNGCRSMWHTVRRVDGCRGYRRARLTHHPFIDQEWAARTQGGRSDAVCLAVQYAVQSTVSFLERCSSKEEAFFLASVYIVTRSAHGCVASAKVAALRSALEQFGCFDSAAGETVENGIMTSILENLASTGLVAEDEAFLLANALKGGYAP
jgi:hypothetical protein